MKRTIAIVLAGASLLTAAPTALADDCFNASRPADKPGDANTTKGNWTNYDGLAWGFTYPDNHGTEQAGRYAIRQNNPPSTCTMKGIQHFDVCFGGDGG